jgi:hypothetical protein
LQELRCQAPITGATHGEGGSGSGMPFEGFDPPESNFWRLPNNWFDLAARFTSWAEQKVVEYILRHTWGYHEYDVVKLITMDEFMHGRKRRDGSRIDAGCGMAENSIKKGIHDAVDHGFLIVRTDDSDKGRIRKYYAPRMRRPLVDEGKHTIHAQDQALILEGQTLTLGPQSLTPDPIPLTLEQRSLTPSGQDNDPPTEQATPGKHFMQETQSNNPRPVVVSLPIPRPQGGIRSETPFAVDGHPILDAEGPESAAHRSPTGNSRRNVPTGRSAVSGDGGRYRSGKSLRAIGGTRDGSASKSAIWAPTNQATDLSGSSREAADRGVRRATRPDLVERLAAEGIAPGRAHLLVAEAPAERIERQLAWIDYRSCRDRAATLVKAIAEDFSEPPRKISHATGAGFDSAKYFRGSYALCPHCGSRPCAPDCRTAVRAEPGPD